MCVYLIFHFMMELFLCHTYSSEWGSSSSVSAIIQHSAWIQQSGWKFCEGAIVSNTAKHKVFDTEGNFQEAEWSQTHDQRCFSESWWCDMCNLTM